ncbi:hypothetical protein [Streptomyces sp. NPDC056723]|uniref:hypothetical protein n=1 Tax=Streptomyces sp. NPDC056723 TaxID=3345925 RepID=UPI00367816C4
MSTSSQNDQQRQSLIAAHSAALRLLTLAPIPPTEISVRCPAHAPEEPSLDVHFYRNPEGVRLLAATLDAAVSAGPHSATRPALYTSAATDVSRIPVLIWTLETEPEGGADPAPREEDDIEFGVAATQPGDDWETHFVCDSRAAAEKQIADYGHMYRSCRLVQRHGRHGAWTEATS